MSLIYHDFGFLLWGITPRCSSPLRSPFSRPVAGLRQPAGTRGAGKDLGKGTAASALPLPAGAGGGGRSPAALLPRGGPWGPGSGAGAAPRVSRRGRQGAGRGGARGDPLPRPSAVCPVPLPPATAATTPGPDGARSPTARHRGVAVGGRSAALPPVGVKCPFARTRPPAGGRRHPRTPHTPAPP